MMHKMIVDLNVFSTFMKYIITRNLNHTLIVTKDRRIGGLRNTHIMLETTDPKKLRGGVNKSMIVTPQKLALANLVESLVTNPFKPICA
jgi:hypothetical protein